MLEIDVKLDGIDDLFSHLDATKAKSIQRKALKAGGMIMQQAIAARAPEKVDPDVPGSNSLPKGALKNDIELKVLRGSDGNRIAISIGPGKYTKHVAQWMEYGFHHFTAQKTGNEFTARPFIRPAIAETEGTAQQAILTTLESEIAKVYENGNAPDDSDADIAS